jgi:hypothetical protein
MQSSYNSTQITIAIMYLAAVAALIVAISGANIAFQALTGGNLDPPGQLNIQ